MPFECITQQRLHAVLKVMSDIPLALDTGNLALLILLDFSAAFDSVDHSVLLRRLQKSYGIHGAVFSSGSSPTALNVGSLSVRGRLKPLRPRCFMVCHRARSSGDPVRPIHRRCPTVGQRLRTDATRIRRRHSDSWHLSPI